MPLSFYGHPLAARAVLRDGTVRAATLDETWSRFRGRQRTAGITRLADLTGLDTLGIPVFAAIRPMGRSLSTQQGKGLTADAARISALMESLETWSAEHVTLPRVRGTYRALRPRAIDVRRLPRPRRKLDLDAPWRWVRGWDLLQDREVLVPEEAVSLDTTFRRSPVFDMSSNGLASGNALVEAVLHGLYELIERDAEAAWRRAGGDRRLVLDSITDAGCRALLARITDAGARVFVWDLGGPFADAVTTIGCAIMEDPHEPAWRTLGFYQGFGAHRDPEVAIARAVTEAAQTRLTYIAGGRDDFFPFDYARATDPALMSELWTRLASPCDEPVLYDDLPQRSSGPVDLGADLEDIADRLRGAGRASIVVVDLTHPALGVPVVKVVVPGLATDVEAMG